MSGEWSVPKDSVAHRRAVEVLESHVPHYTDAAGLTHWDNSNAAPGVWNGLSGQTGAERAAEHSQALLQQADLTQQAADTLRGAADHIDATNATKNLLDGQHASDLANAKTPLDAMRANDSFLKNVDALQQQFDHGADGFTRQLDAARTAAADNQVPQTPMASQAPPGTGVTPGNPGPGGSKAAAVPAPATKTFTGATLTDKIAAASGRATTGLSQATVHEPVTHTAQQQTQAQSKRPVVAPAPVPVPDKEGGGASRPGPLAGLPGAQALGRAALACLVVQFRHVGWPTQLAVATVKRDEERQLVYATSDALSVWPLGVRLPHRTLPLDLITGLEPTEAAEQQGYTRPARKLAALLEITDWEVEAIVSTDLAEADGKLIAALNDVELHQIIESDAMARPIIDRPTLARIKPEAVETLVIRLRSIEGLSGELPDLPTAGAALRDARWSDKQTDGYATLFMQWLMVDALTCRQDRETGGDAQAAYPVGVLMTANIG